MECRVLKSGKCEITQGCNKKHTALDIVGENYTLDKIVAHSNGKIISIQDGYNNIKGSTGKIAYGNYIKIEHSNGYSTLYAHLQKGLSLKIGDKIKKGQVLGYMSDSGNAYGAHLHFEIFKNGNKIDPTTYLNKDLYTEPNNQVIKLKYDIGDKVKINGVYISSNSNKKLIPIIKKGIITKIVPNTRNPYLLDEGKIGWINDDCIIKEQYICNKSYKGSSIVDALKEINIDSSYKSRKKIAKLNDIKNYKGTTFQNTYLLNLLKIGKLKY